MAIMVDIMASVEPQQTVISRSGSIVESVGAVEFFGDGVAQRFRAPGDGVLIDVRGDGVLRGALDFRGRGKIGKALREIDGAVLQREARHLANHGFGELRSAFAERRGLALAAALVALRDSFGGCAP